MSAIMMIIGAATLVWNIYATVTNGKNGFWGAALLGIVFIAIGIFSLVF